MKYTSQVLISGFCAIGVWGIYFYTVSTCPVLVDAPYQTVSIIKNPVLQPIQDGAKQPAIITDGAKACASVGGVFDKTYHECAGVEEKTCTHLGGTFVDCGSACRHNPKAEMCTLQCVVYCQL